MRFTILLLICLLGVVGLHAQRGTVLVYGDINLDVYGGTSKQSIFSIRPGVGYQFTDHMTAGVDFSYLKFKIGSSDNIKKYSVGPFIRFSMPLNDWFGVYSQLGAGYVSQPSANLTGFYGQIFPALYLKVKDNFGLNFSTGALNFEKLGDSWELHFRYGIIPTIGVSANFGGKRNE